eukprot:TRINITY_DN2613_c0_g1_i1.p1 TRINITY_DN2613_c0_g1~~TRINITY_DN2613_c0_g1_i1.p1  ORF type:complete len:532 (+),score=155.34 TRINITY_DN2613_c0_g1_i1:117-1712(+)
MTTKEMELCQHTRYAALRTQRASGALPEEEFQEMIKELFGNHVDVEGCDCGAVLGVCSVGVDCLGRDCAAAIASALRSQHSRILRLLIQMDDQEEGDTILDTLCSAIPESPLKSLNIWNCGITFPGVQSLADAISKGASLIELDISSNQIGDNGISVLCKSFTENPTLKYLNAENCELTVKGVESLSSAIKKGVELIELKISKNSIKDKGIAQLCNAFIENKSITALDVEGCCISESGIKSICDALRGGVNLVGIDLSSNYIQDSGISILCEGVTANHSVKSLLIENCGITTTGGELILSAVLKSMISEVYIEENDVDPSLSKIIKEACSLTSKHDRSTKLNHIMEIKKEEEQKREDALPCGACASALIKGELSQAIFQDFMIKLKFFSFSASKSLGSVFLGNFKVFLSSWAKRFVFSCGNSFLFYENEKSEFPDFSLVFTEKTAIVTEENNDKRGLFGVNNSNSISLRGDVFKEETHSVCTIKLSFKSKDEKMRVLSLANNAKNKAMEFLNNQQETIEEKLKERKSEEEE